MRKKYKSKYFDIFVAAVHTIFPDDVFNFLHSVTRGGWAPLMTSYYSWECAWADPFDGVPDPGLVTSYCTWECAWADPLDGVPDPGLMTSYCTWECAWADPLDGVPDPGLVLHHVGINTWPVQHNIIQQVNFFST